jgi:hypothetical protein
MLSDEFGSLGQALSSDPLTHNSLRHSKVVATAPNIGAQNWCDA